MSTRSSSFDNFERFLRCFGHQVDPHDLRIVLNKLNCILRIKDLAGEEKRILESLSEVFKKKYVIERNKQKQIHDD